MSDPGGVQTAPMDVENPKLTADDRKEKEPMESDNSKSPMEADKSKSHMKGAKPKSPKKKKSIPEIRLDTKRKMLRQVEYYFSDSNLHTDKFLKDTMKENDGWIPIKKLFDFPRIKQLVEKGKREIPGVNSMELLVEALRESKELLRVSEEGGRVQRATPLIDPKIIAERTVAVFGFPTKREFNVEEQKMFWGQFGGVLSVKRYVPHKGNAPKCMVFVEFDSKEIAEDVIQSEVLDYDGIEVTLKKRQLPNARKRKRGEEVMYQPDKLLKLTEFPQGIKWFELRRWMESNDVQKGFFVHLKDDHAYIRLNGEASAAEVAKKLENKPWAENNQTITKVEVLQDGEETWKSLVKSLMHPRRQMMKRARRGGREHLKRMQTGVPVKGANIDVKAVNQEKTEPKTNTNNETGDAVQMEEDV